MARILLPTDFSENAMHAAEYAVQLFGAQGNSFLLLHVFFDNSVGAPMVASWTPELYTILQEDLRTFAQRFKQRSGAEGVEENVVFGVISSTIHLAAKEKSADHIVMGAQGISGLSALLLGSTTTDVINFALVPVLVVPGQTPLARPSRILLADDHGDVVVSDLAPLRRIAQVCDAEVIVAHVEMDDPDGSDHWSQGIYEIGLTDVKHSFTEAHGLDVVDGLERAAKHRKVGMIAVLHRHLGFLKGLFHRSETKHLALHTELPLLVLQHTDV